MKFNDIKKNVNDFIKYVGVGLFTINSVLLTIISMICYCYAISSVVNSFNINNSVSSGSIAVAILLLVLVFLLVLILASIGVYFLTKLIINQINNLNKDEIFFYYFGKRWITGLVSLLLGFATLFGFGKLYGIFIPFYNNAFSILISISWFICSAINFGYFFYSMIWLKRQPKQYQEKYMSVIHQLKTSEKTRNDINKESEIIINELDNSNKIEEDKITQTDSVEVENQQKNETNLQDNEKDVKNDN